MSIKHIPKTHTVPHRDFDNVSETFYMATNTCILKEAMDAEPVAYHDVFYFFYF